VLISEFPLSRDENTRDGSELSGFDHALHLAKAFSRYANRVRGNGRKIVTVRCLANSQRGDEQEEDYWQNG
jgi:hypothetical protein